MLALAQLPSEHAIHLHAVAVVHFHFLPSAVGDELLLHNVAHLDEAPYLIQSGNVFRLQAIYAIVERICTAQQVPSAVHLRISCGFLKHEALLVKTFEATHGAEEWIVLKVLERCQRVVHVGLHLFAHILKLLDALFQRGILVRHLAQGIFQEAVLLCVVAQRGFLYVVEVAGLTPMLGKFIFQIGGNALQLVGALVGAGIVQPVAGAVDDVPHRLDKFRLFFGEDAPPHYFGAFALRVNRKSVESATHIVDGEHTIFALDVLQYLAPMLVVVEFCAQHLEAKRECSLFAIQGVGNADFATPYIVAIVQKASQNATAE